MVITDLTMPKIIGIDLAEKLLAIRPDLPILLCSGISDPDVMNRARQKGIQGFLKKPFSRSQLARTVRKALDDSSS